MLLAVDGFFSRTGLSEFGFRWLHILAGIMWIGLLYFFNFVQVPAYALFEADPHKEIGGKARMIALDTVTRRALWWFRWAALGTFLTGIAIVGITEHYFGERFAQDGSGQGVLTSGMKIAGNVGIMTGMLLGTIMMLNVWGVIWRNRWRGEPSRRVGRTEGVDGLASEHDLLGQHVVLHALSIASPARRPGAVRRKAGCLLGHRAADHRRARAQLAWSAAVEDASQQGPERDLRRPGRA
jgi:uncharacterized membrane protein